MTPFKDLTGQKYNRWKVLNPATTTDGRLGWFCQCECGNYGLISHANLTKSKSKSCGCFMKEHNSSHFTKHGETKTQEKTPEYKAWASVKGRTLNPKNDAYADYGGRGIKVCERWKDSFSNFLSDMGRRPSPKHSLDRIDNNGNYEPGNCRWATHKVQSNNRRSNVILTYKGKSQSMSRWAEELGLKIGTIHRRISLGWRIPEALTKSHKI